MINVLLILAVSSWAAAPSVEDHSSALVDECPSVDVKFNRWANIDGWRAGVFEVVNNSSMYIRYPVSQPKSVPAPLLSVHTASLFTRPKESGVWTEILTMGSSRVPEAKLVLEPYGKVEVLVNLERAFYEDEFSGGGVFIELINGLVSCSSRSNAISLDDA